MDCESTSQETMEEKGPQFLVSSIGNLGQDKIRFLFDYPVGSDWLYWKVSLSNRIRIGEIAGSIHHTGYVWIRIYGYNYPAHILCWLHTYGEVAKLDHKDRIPWHNKITNLRKATRSQNMANRVLPSKLGVRGVYEARNGKFEARIQVDGVTIQIGTYSFLEEAQEAYKKVAKHFFGEFANG